MAPSQANLHIFVFIYPHSLHGEGCAFVLNPDLHRLSIGNVKIPSIDWMMKNIFMVSNPHEAVNKAVFWGLHVPLGRVLAKCNTLAISADPPRASPAKQK